jgi:broad specificity phosphatase PhoE
MNVGKLYLVRHGESMGNVWPLAYKDDRRNFLSPYGAVQARHTAAYFKRMNINFNTVVSSGLTRACETCAIILREVGWERQWDVEPGLNEVNKEEDKIRVRVAFTRFLSNWNVGDALVVTHYHTMQVLFDELTHSDRSQVDSYGGRHVGNASVFEWSPLEPKKIKLLDLTRTGDQH